jgi:MFS family permease
MNVLTATILRVFLPFAAGYFLSYLYRTVNAVIAPDLIADIGVGPSSLGLLTAVYFISFASFQLPLGILLDRYGPRKVEAALLLFAGLGAFIFARAESLGGLIAGRAFIGFGVSACLMAAFKAYTQWFDRRNWPLINGFQMAAGGLGALAATAPVELALLHTDWRGVFSVLSLLTFCTAVLIFAAVPEKKTNTSKETLQLQLRGIYQIFTSRAFWRLALVTAITQATFSAVQGLWAGPYLTHVAGLERAQVANTLFWVAGAMICGFIVLGSLASRLGRQTAQVAGVAVAGLTLFLVAQFVLIVAPPALIFPAWLAFGFFGTSGIIAYSALSQTFPPGLSGRVTTAVNLLVFIGAFCCQWFIGIIIDAFTAEKGGSYSVVGFRWAFGIILLLEVLSLFLYFVLGRKKTDKA